MKHPCVELRIFLEVKVSSIWCIWSPSIQHLRSNNTKMDTHTSRQYGMVRYHAVPMCTDKGKPEKGGGGVEEREKEREGRLKSPPLLCSFIGAAGQSPCFGALAKRQGEKREKGRGSERGLTSPPLHSFTGGTE